MSTTYPDVSEYDERGFAPPIQPGNYIITLDDIHEATNDGEELRDKNGEPYYRFIFKIKDHPENTVLDMVYTSLDGPYKNVRGGKIKQIILAFGLSPKGGDFALLLHKSCRATISINEYTKGGNTYVNNKIIAYEPLDEADEALKPEKKSDGVGF